MSFDTLYTSATQGLHLTKASEGWVFGQGVPERTQNGPDVLKLCYDGYVASGGNPPALTSFELGATPPTYAGDGTWRVTSAVPRRLWGPFWRLDVICMGQIATKLAEVRWLTATEQASGENVSVPGYAGLVPRVRTENPQSVVEVGYLNTTAAPTAASVGVAATPPSPSPGDPTNIWTWIDEDQAVIHYPDEWVRQGYEAERIVPNLWWIRERFGYVFEMTT